VRGLGAAAASATGGLPLVGRGQAAAPEPVSSPLRLADLGGETHAASRTPSTRRDPASELVRAGTARRAGGVPLEAVEEVVTTPSLPSRTAVARMG
jgi:hypothetical protein